MIYVHACKPSKLHLKKNMLVIFKGIYTLLHIGYYFKRLYFYINHFHQVAINLITYGQPSRNAQEPLVQSDPSDPPVNLDPMAREEPEVQLDPLDRQVHGAVMADPVSVCENQAICANRLHW